MQRARTKRSQTSSWVNTFQSLSFLFQVEIESQDMFWEQKELLLPRLVLVEFNPYLDEAMLTPSRLKCSGSFREIRSLLRGRSKNPGCYRKKQVQTRP